MKIDSKVRVHKLKTAQQRSVFPWRDSLLSGLFTGLAWWTKYNGWLPLAIGLSGGMFWQVLKPPAERQFLRFLSCWLVMAVVAVTIWSPVLWDLQPHGGYASVAANHRGYVVGLKGWGDSAVRQIEHVGTYDNWVSLLTQPFGEPDRNDKREFLQFVQHGNWAQTFDWLSSAHGGGIRNLLQKLSLLLTWIATFTLPVLLWLVVAIALRLRIRWPADDRRQLGTCLLAAWYCGMTVATPMYYPYPRLVLPWLTAIWLGLGLAIQLWRSRRNPILESTSEPVATAASDTPQSGAKPNPAVGNSWKPTRLEWVIVIWVLSNSCVRSIQGTAHALRDRTSAQTAAKNIAQKIAEQIDVHGSIGDQAIVYVYGEPAILFGLYGNGLKLVVAIPDVHDVLRPLSTPTPLPKFLVFANQSVEKPTFRDVLSKLEPVPFPGQHTIEPSHLAEMDSLDGGRASHRFYATPKVELYRVR